jgi:Tol biopolymer transport system component
MTKTSSLFFIIIFISAVAFSAGYYFSGKNPSGTDILSSSLLSKFEVVGNNNETDKMVPYLPSTSQPLNSEGATSLTISTNPDSIVYYEKKTGRIIELNYALGTKAIITNNSLANFISSIWSPDKKSVISLFYDSLGNYYKYYNFKTKKVSVFKNNIKSITYSPDSKNIIYLQEDTLDNAIYVALPDGSSRKKILNTRLQNIELFWPATNRIYIQTTSDRDGTSSLFRINETGSTLKLLENGLEMQVNFSADGKRFLSSYIADGELVTKLIIENDKEISLKKALWANECAWSANGDLIYCVSPRINEDSSPAIIEYSVLDDAIRQVGNLPFNGRVNTAILSTSENYLILLSRATDKIYAIKITR